MELFVVAIFDRVTEIYAQPAFVPTTGAAIRGLGDEVNKEGSPIAAHVDDFDLYVIGMYDDRNGLLTATPPRLLALARDLKR